MLDNMLKAPTELTEAELDAVAAAGGDEGNNSQNNGLVNVSTGQIVIQANVGTNQSYNTNF